MDRKYYLDLAASGLRMPIGTDLALHQHQDIDRILLDGERLGGVMAQAAKQWQTPLAFALMDLALEKDLILDRLGVPHAQREQYHFSDTTTDDLLARATLPGNLTPRMKANLAALSHVARTTSAIPVGMVIGPFSLMTKLLSDPITPVYLAGAGTSAAEDEEVKRVETLLEIGTRIILESVEAQANAGAKAIIIAEPAANIAYFSPNQLAEGSDIYQRYVTAFNLRVAQRIRDMGMDLLFHCCGELTPGMVKAFTTLDPVLLSLGSSRKLWEDAALVPNNIVLFGNLPTKRFYSDDLVSPESVAQMSCDLLRRMKALGHPFILGSECDVLSVPGAEETIKRKVAVMLQCKCD